MPGTVVRDANAPNLLDGSTLNSAGTTNGTVWDAQWPGHIQFTLATGTVTGSSTPTITVDIQGCETSDFSTGDVVTYATLVNAASNTVVGASTFVDSRYVRARVTLSGTSPVFTGSTLRPVLEHDRRVRDDGTGNGLQSPTAKALA